MVRSRRRRVGRLVGALVALVALAVAAGACGGSGDDQGSGGGAGGGAGGGRDGGASPAVYEAGDSITVATGATFVIALEANPTTGYSWTAQPNPNATFVSSKQVTSSTLVGAGGVQQLTFRATAPGSSTLVLDYTRPFEPGVPPVQSQSFPLTVRG